MESMKDSTLSQLNSKVAKSYFANFTTILSYTIKLQLLFVTARSMFLGFLLSISSLELIFDSVKFNENNLQGFEHYFAFYRGGINFCLSVPSEYCSQEKDSLFLFWPFLIIHFGV